MRIRTTRQAQLIRAGVERALSTHRWARRKTKRDHPLTQHAFAIAIRRRNKPPAGVEEYLRVDHPDRWEVGDEIVCIPAGDGWVYINKEAAERMGIDLIAKINKREDMP